MIKKLVNLIYILFIVLFLISSIIQPQGMNLIPINILAIIGLILLKKHKIEIKNFNILIIIGVIIRIFLLFINPLFITNDYGNFYYTALELAEKGYTNSQYMAMYPHLMPYIATLAFIFKIMGSTYKSVIILNILFDIFSAFIIYKITNNKKICILWLLNPLNIVWCYMCHPATITNSLLILSIYIFKKLYENKKILYSLLLGIILALANLYRPVMIIFLIAIFIYLIILNYKKIHIILFILILPTYLFTGYVIKNNIKFNKWEKTKSTLGWNLYVGANLESTGRYSMKLGEELNKQFKKEKDVTKIQNHFKEKAIMTYKKNGIKNIPLIVKKYILISNNIDIYSINEMNLILNFKMNKILKYLISVIARMFYYYILVKSITNKNNDHLKLFSIGLLMAHFILEVSPRYLLPIFPALTILTNNDEKV